jgi:tRNA-Thr(GGU) m(6)t(6)A37 methyltransferase TsaA
VAGAVDDVPVIVVEPVAFVRSPRDDLADDDWGRVRSRIELADHVPDVSFDGLEAFSHVEVVFHFDRVAPDAVVTDARHPRGNPEWPRVGIFAQRAKNRPNRLGTTIARIVERDGRTLVVEGLDAIDGTPVLDVKPVMSEFLPREPVRQPAWATELMADYWSVRTREP